MERTGGDGVIEFKPRGEARRAFTVERFECRFVWADGERTVGVDIELIEHDGQKGYRSQVRASAGTGYVSRKEANLACARRLETLERLIREAYGPEAG